MKVRVIGSEAEVSVLLAALAAAAGISVQKVSDRYPSRTRGQVRVYVDVEVKEVPVMTGPKAATSNAERAAQLRDAIVQMSIRYGTSRYWLATAEDARDRAGIARAACRAEWQLQAVKRLAASLDGGRS